MNRIRRVLLSRVGYRDAWYDGTLLYTSRRRWRA